MGSQLTAVHSDGAAFSLMGAAPAPALSGAFAEEGADLHMKSSRYICINLLL
jgi:hypothetical protein